MRSGEQSQVDVAVIGGGIEGLAVAWRAAQRGLSVTLLERERVGCGASRVAAGMLAPVSELEFGAHGHRVLELGLRSAAIWVSFGEQLQRAAGMEIGMTSAGTLMVARDEDEGRELERQYELRRSLGLRARRLRPSEVREREPALAPVVRMGVEAPDDHSVDPRRAVGALRVACERAGVQIRERAPARGIVVQDGRVTGVMVGSDAGDVQAGGLRSVDREAAGVKGERACVGEGDFLGGGGDGAQLAARTVVVAAGSWSGAVEGLPAYAQVPVRPVKGQIMLLRDPAGAGMLSHVVRYAGGYLVGRGDGRYVLGGTVEERGFDAQPTAGAVYELLRRAYELVPGVSECELIELNVGHRPGTPDNAPIVGEGAIEGLVWATGHYRNGILLAPLTAELVAGLLTGEHSQERDLLASCDPARFIKTNAATAGEEDVAAEGALR
jgi:glycine oxidase